MTVEGGESGGFDDGLSATGADQLMADVFGDLRVRQARKGVVDGDALAQSLMDRFSQGIVEIRLAAEDQGKTVDRVIAVIHQHFNIIEDSGGEILRLIHCQQKGLAFLFVDSPKHAVLKNSMAIPRRFSVPLEKRPCCLFEKYFPESIRIVRCPCEQTDKL